MVIKMKNRRFILIKGKKMPVRVDENNVIKSALCGGCADDRGITSVKEAKKQELFYIYKNGECICPRCGKTIEVLKTPEQYKEEIRQKEEEMNKKALENLYLGINGGMDMICGTKYFSLSAQIDYDDWKDIKHLMFYYKSHGEEDFIGGKPSGWVTTQPEKVEEILIRKGLMRTENTIANRNKKAKKEEEERKQKREEIDRLEKEIKSSFKDAETPKIDEQLHSIEEYGDVIVKRMENPNYPWNIYGGGQEYVICEKHIWFLRNNGSDGSNWGLNNVATGGAGAIGSRVKFSKELEYLIETFIEKSR